MIVLKDESLPTVREEYRAPAALNNRTTFRQNWGKREQLFHWVNNIRYEFGPNDQHHLSIHVGTCTEQWQEAWGLARKSAPGGFLGDAAGAHL